MWRLTILLMAVALAGCGDKTISREAIDEAFVVCVNRDGLRTLTIDYDTYTVGCNDGRSFSGSKYFEEKKK